MARIPANNRSLVQASEATYELHTLGWKAFQNLCVTVMGSIWGQTVQSFFDSHDGGRDGAFAGKWTAKSGEVFEGTFTAQCKFTAKADKHLHIKDLADELDKAKRLAARGLADNYFLFTNARMTGVAEEKIREDFLKIDGIKQFKAYGAERISQFIRESARLRMLVPRVYGLGDLSHILDERACAQATEILSALGSDLGKFVVTDAHRRSANALIEHRFVLLLGEPACGKSTIAAALAVGALDEWGCSTFKIRNAEEFVKHSNPNEPNQFFWIDDAFGATQLDQEAVREWNSTLAHMNAAMRRGARILFTSRSYVYQYARQYLKESSFPALSNFQVIVEVEQLAKEEREQILFNHIRLGNQSQSFKQRIKPNLAKIAANSKFSPEIARRLGNSEFTSRLVLDANGIASFVENPIEHLAEVIRTLDDGSRAALALIFMRNGRVASPVDLLPEEVRSIERIGATLSDVLKALKALNESLIIQTKQGGSHLWQFKHPTIQDAFAEVIADDRELMGVYLSGTPLRRLLKEVVCGDVEIKGARLVVPSELFDQIIGRLAEADFNDERQRWAVNDFIANRSSREFVERYLLANPLFVEHLKVGSYLFAYPDVPVIVKLYDLGLLPEDKRKAIAYAIHILAVESPDDGFVMEDIRRLLTQGEFESIVSDVKSRLLPRLSSVIGVRRDEYYESEKDPDTFFDGFEDVLKGLLNIFVDDEESCGLIVDAIVEINELIDELRNEPKPEPYNEFAYEEYREQQIRQRHRETLERSIFDDIDE